MTAEWKIFAVFIVIVTIAIAWLLVANADLRARLAMAETENAALHLSNADFKTEAERQNRAVAILETGDARRNLRARMLKEAGAMTAEGDMADAARIEKLPPSADGCRAADALLGIYISGLR